MKWKRVCFSCLGNAGFAAVAALAFLHACSADLNTQILNAEKALTAANQSATNAATSGLLIPGSSKALSVKAGLDAANDALDTAKSAAASGDTSGAETALQSATGQTTSAAALIPVGAQ